MRIRKHPVDLSSLSMKEGLEAIIWKRKDSDPSGASGPKASGGSSVAWLLVVGAG